MDIAKLTMQLSAASGPSGFEDGARALIRENLAPFVDSLTTDSMENLIGARRCGKANARSIMLNAHMDEIGFIVTGHEDGYLRFAALGGIDPRMLPARELKILTAEPVYGVVDVMPPHALSGEDMDNSLPIDKLFIDVGMTQEEAERTIPLGTPAVFAGAGMCMGENMLCGKSMDDRSCVAVLIRVMEELSGKCLDIDVYCLVSVQEELGMRGAVTGAYGIAPDCAIAIDVTHGATPDAPKHKTLEIGKGAAIGVGPNFSRSFTNHIIDFAKSNDIPHQLEVIPGHSGTDAWPIQISREGIATALISLPLKYMHSPVETLCISDAESIVKLVSGFISGMEVI